jgi:hypothetical protein
MMGGHTVVHRRPDASLKAHIANMHLASLMRWRVSERRDALATLVFEGRQRVWVSEDAAKFGKRRSLIDDNPASG